VENAAAAVAVVPPANKGDAAVPNQLNFQTPATAIMEKIVDLHHDLMFFIIVIVVFVS
jgi:cytochrome c oxidase subunit 2